MDIEFPESEDYDYSDFVPVMRGKEGFCFAYKRKYKGPSSNDHNLHLKEQDIVEFHRNPIAIVVGVDIAGEVVTINKYTPSVDNEMRVLPTVQLPEDYASDEAATLHTAQYALALQSGYHSTETAIAATLEYNSFDIGLVHVVLALSVQKIGSDISADDVGSYFSPYGYDFEWEFDGDRITAINEPLLLSQKELFYRTREVVTIAALSLAQELMPQPA